jgi:hypothetical protein
MRTIVYTKLYFAILFMHLTALITFFAISYIPTRFPSLKMSSRGRVSAWLSCSFSNFPLELFSLQIVSCTLTANLTP